MASVLGLERWPRLDITAALSKGKVMLLIMLISLQGAFFGPIDGMVGLIAEDHLPFIAVPGTFLLCTNALPTRGSFKVTLVWVRVSLAVSYRKKK